MLRPISAQANQMLISVTSTASTSTALPNKGNTLRVVNTGSSTAYISVGSSDQTAAVPTSTAAATGCPVLAGVDVSFSIPDDSVQNISAITGSGTTSLIVQVGDGF